MTTPREALESFIAEAGKCPRCYGRGIIVTTCRFCGDSTFDHVCIDEERTCSHCNGTGERPSAARARDALRELGPAPDTGWRERAPERWERDAHDGLWGFCPNGPPIEIGEWEEMCISDEEDGAWRPYDRDGNPVAWPEVKP